MITMLDRYRGSIIGLAIGDAVGTTLEFASPGSFDPITNMVGGGPFSLEPGEWTDDTSMMLCLGTSLVDCKGFDALDQMKRYCKWYREGFMSSNGECFDIGVTVRTSLEKFECSGEPFSGPVDTYSAGNGSLMRLAPIPLAYRLDVGKAFRYAELSSRTTHGATIAVDACRLMTALILRALAGDDKESILNSHSIFELFADQQLCPEIKSVAQGSFKTLQPPQIKGTGYAAKSLEAALWAFANSHSFEEGCLKAANLGDDADTTSAIYGQLAGAHYGICGIPWRWLELIAERELLESLAFDLHQFSDTLSP